MTRQRLEALVAKATEILVAARDLPHRSPGREAAERIARAYLAEAAAFISPDVVPTAAGRAQSDRRMDGNEDRDEQANGTDVD